MESLRIFPCTILAILSIKVRGEILLDSVNIPKSHMSRHLNTFHEEMKLCRLDENCGLRNTLDAKLCWGYESDCPSHLGYSNAHCPGDHKGWVNTKSQQLQTFFEQADFGYIKKQRGSKKVLCHPQSQVRCSKLEISGCH